MIKIENITKTFRNQGNPVQGLKKTSLKIKEGSFLVIVGPSGSGKTSLLNIIGGLDTPTTGQITVKDRNLKNLSDKELSNYRNNEIGFVFQEFHLEPEMTVLDNVLLPTLFSKDKKDKKEKATELIKEVGLTKKINQKTKALSGGEKQRTAIARALINNPTIIIADEPTGNLDAETGKIILNLLKKIHKNHKTTLIIATHDEKVASATKQQIKL